MRIEESWGQVCQKLIDELARMNINPWVDCYFHKPLHQTGRLWQRTECIAMIYKHVERNLCICLIMFLVSGDYMVPVANCDQQKYSSHPKVDMKFSVYIKYWKELRRQNYPTSMDILYLKDWHFTRYLLWYSWIK